MLEAKIVRLRDEAKYDGEECIDIATKTALLLQDKLESIQSLLFHISRQIFRGTRAGEEESRS